MMKQLGVMVVMIAGVFLTGCKDETKSEIWYKQHPDETFTVYSKCLKTGESSDNCENARNAKNYFADIGTPEQQKKFATLDVK